MATRVVSSATKTPGAGHQPWRGSIVLAKLPTGEGRFLPHSASSQIAIPLLPLVGDNFDQVVIGWVIEGMGNVSMLRRVDPTAEKKSKGRCAARSYFERHRDPAPKRTPAGTRLHVARRIDANDPRGDDRRPAWPTAVKDRREFFRRSGLVLAGGPAIAGGAVAAAACELVAADVRPITVAAQGASPATLIRHLTTFRGLHPARSIALRLIDQDAASAVQIRRAIGRLFAKSVEVSSATDVTSGGN